MQIKLRSKHRLLEPLSAQRQSIIKLSSCYPVVTDLRTNLEVILPMREVEVRWGVASDAAVCCDRLGEVGGPL